MREEQVTFITGASRGFGLATAHELARRGHPVVSTMRMVLVAVAVLFAESVAV